MGKLAAWQRQRHRDGSRNIFIGWQKGGRNFVKRGNCIKSEITMELIKLVVLGICSNNIMWTLTWDGCWWFSIAPLPPPYLRGCGFLPPATCRWEPWSGLSLKKNPNKTLHMLPFLLQILQKMYVMYTWNQCWLVGDVCFGVRSVVGRSRPCRFRKCFVRDSK